MVAVPNFNPLLTTNAPGTFGVTSDGYVQGAYMDDPAIRFQLTSGVLAASETLPMWAGVAISESLAGTAAAPGSPMGNIITRAAAQAQISGFSTLNQNHNWISSPQSECPAAASGQNVNFFRLGSRARIPLACDPAIASLVTGLIAPGLVSWDYNAQRLVPFVASYAANAFTSLTWAGGIVTATTTSAHGLVSGADVTVAGVTPAAYNGDFSVTVTGANTFTYPLPNGGTSPGTVTTLGGIAAGGGALPVKVVDINIGNSKVVQYDSVNNFVHWNNTGSCALVEI